MRLTRSEGPPEGRSQLVAVVPPPNAALAANLDELYSETYKRLHVPALDHAEHLLSAEDAQDAVADAMLILWNRWATLTPEQRSDRWIFGLVHRCVRVKRRQNQRDAKSRVSLEDAEDELEAITASAFPEPTRGDSTAEVIEAALRVMPPRRREVLILVRWQDFTYEEAADAMGLSIGTINTHMKLASRDLKTAFTRAGFRIENFRPARLLAPKGDATND